ncbi:Mercuric transport protein periplasmic component precursor [compost metagenome]
MKMMLDVPKIKCGGCAETIQETLGGVTGVSEVEVDIDAKRVAVDIDPSQTSEAAVRERLAQAGFPAS